MHVRVRIAEAVRIRLQGIGALGVRQPIAEVGVKLRAEYFRPFEKSPSHFLRGRKENGTQDKARDTLGMFFGIGQCQRRAPGTADQQPLGDIEMVTDDFEIGDEVSGRIGAARQIGMAPAGATLVDQEDVIARRIEQGPVRMLRTAARSSMQKDDGAATPAADFFDVDPVTVSDVQHARVERPEGFRQCFHHRLLSTEFCGGQDGCADTARKRVCISPLQSRRRRGRALQLYRGWQPGTVHLR